MPIPDYQTIMLPLLQIGGDDQEHRLRDCVTAISDQFNLTEAERREKLPSGTQRTIHNRVAWARTYLQKAGLLTAPRRGAMQISQRGRELLAENPTRIDIKLLDRYPEFVEFRTPKKKDNDGPGALSASTTLASEVDPEEQLESAHQTIQAQLASDLLETVMECSPAFFEQLVVDLIVGMGYGGSHKEAGEAVGGSGDGGIDGIIKEDRLGLDAIYLQAKRWEGTVSRPEIQKFAGALQGFRAKKGIFITTSGFSREANSYAGDIDTKIILIDGQQLAELMIEHDSGVSRVASYELKRLDTDYFAED